MKNIKQNRKRLNTPFKTINDYDYPNKEEHTFLMPWAISDFSYSTSEINIQKPKRERIKKKAS